MDPETMLDTVGKSCEAATKLQEIIQKIFGPRWTKRQADADAYADERKFQTIRDNPDMEIVYTPDGMSARARSPEAMARRAEQRMLNDAIRQEGNIENVLTNAAREIEQITDVDDKRVDDDWITRFFSIVKDINSEEMQCIWGKILAGEVRKTGSFSLRTLEAVRNLSKDEAALFQKLVPFVLKYEEDGITDYFVLSNENAENDISYRYGFDYSDMVKLEEAQLVSADTAVAIYVDVHPDKESVIEGFNSVIICKNHGEEQITLSQNAFFLTAIGAELLPIVREGTNPPLNPYFEDCCHSLRYAAKLDPVDEADKLEVNMKAPCSV